MAAIKPKASWVTDQQLNPWDEPIHFVLNGDLTKASPYKKDEVKPTQTKSAQPKSQAGKA